MPRGRGGYPRNRALVWSPPTLTTPTTINVSADGSNRRFILTAGQDYIIQLPSSAITGPRTPTVSSGYFSTDYAAASVHIKNGRNITIIGGAFNFATSRRTTLSNLYTDGDSVVTVGDTTGFPARGTFFSGGYEFFYASKTGTTFNGVERNPTSFGAASFPLPVAMPVYTGQAERSGIQIEEFTGTLHIEGVLFGGDLSDGLRVQTTSGTASTFQLQNCRFDASRSYDVNGYDGHPDNIQFIAGPHTARLDRITGFTNGRGLLNKADAGNACASIAARDVSFGFAGNDPDNVRLWHNYEAGTTWDCQGCWARPGGAALATSIPADGDPTNVLSKQIAVGYPRRDFVPAETVGLNYTSPGYL